jgi:hypothetical protein
MDTTAQEYQRFSQVGAHLNCTGMLVYFKYQLTLCRDRDEIVSELVMHRILFLPDIRQGRTPK